MLEKARETFTELTRSGTSPNSRLNALTRNDNREQRHPGDPSGENSLADAVQIVTDVTDH